MLKNIFRCIKDKEIIGSRQHDFTKGNSKKFHGEVTGLVDERRAVDIFYLDFSKAFDA